MSETKTIKKLKSLGLILGLNLGIAILIFGGYYFWIPKDFGQAQTIASINPTNIELTASSPIYADGILIFSPFAPTGTKAWIRAECVGGTCSGASFDYSLTANLREGAGLSAEVGILDDQGQARVLTGTEAFNWGRIYPGVWRIFFSLRDTVPIDHSNELGPLEVNVVEYQHPCVLEAVVIGQRPTCFSSPPGISAAALEVIPEVGLIPGLEPITGLRFFAPSSVTWRSPYEGQIYHIGDSFVFDGLTVFRSCENAPSSYQMGFSLEGTELGFNSSDRIAVDSYAYPYEWRSNFDFDSAVSGNQETIPAGIPPGNYMARLLMKFKIEAGSAWQMAQYLGLRLSGAQAERILSCMDVDIALGRDYLYQDPNYIPPASPCPIMNGWVFNDATRTFILEETRAAVVPGENKWVYNLHDPLALQQWSIQSPYFRMGERRVTLASPPASSPLSCQETIYPDRPTTINWQSAGESVRYQVKVFDSSGNLVSDFNANQNLSFSFGQGTVNSFDLTPGGVYELQIIARDEWGQASQPATCQMSVQPLPSIPSWSFCPTDEVGGVSIVSPPTLTWNPVQNAEKYWVEIFDGVLGRFLKIPGSETSGTRFSYNASAYGPLSYNDQARFRLAASNSASEAIGEVSYGPICSVRTEPKPENVFEESAAAAGADAAYNVAAVTEETCFQQACVTPPSPSKVAIEYLGGNDLDVRWFWPGEETDAQGFVVERQKDGGPWEFLIRILYAKSDNRISQKNLAPGTYQYRVRALNSAHLCDFTLRNCDSPIDVPGAMSDAIIIPDVHVGENAPLANISGATTDTGPGGTTVVMPPPPIDGGDGDGGGGTGGCLNYPATPVLENITASCSASLNWNDVDYEQSYEVQRRVPGGNWVTIAETNANQNQYADNNAGNNYEYRVKARRTEGSYTCNSEFSNIQNFVLNCVVDPPDPCAGVSCDNYCDSTTRKESGACQIINGAPQCVYGITTPQSSLCGYNQPPRAAIKGRNVGSTYWVTGTLYSVVGKEVEIEGVGEDPEDDMYPQKNTLDLVWGVSKPAASVSSLQKEGVVSSSSPRRLRKDIERATILIDKEGTFEVAFEVRDGREDLRTGTSTATSTALHQQSDYLVGASFFEKIYKSIAAKLTDLFPRVIAQGRGQRDGLIIRAGSSCGFSFDPERPDLGEAVTFTGNNPDIIDEYRWDFGDGNSDVTASPIVRHAYTTSGYYTPILQVFDARTGFTDTCSAGVVYGGIQPRFRER